MSEDKSDTKVELGLLEEDDEFEEFPADTVKAAEEDKEANVWEDNWDACAKRHSYIFRCPFPYIPCEDMWEDSKDFKCGENCNNLGGRRKTSNGGKSLVKVK